uniref:hypothetical protein n=1 Tax=Bradyrhizobium sp. (strain ORS 278) TaxID=114615 RepID=UPI0012FEC696|nr:hypothetical protein [Bradyrhizobium sp. ORS 278]
MGHVIDVAINLFILVAGSLALRERHSRELYILWYIFSGFFLVFLAVEVRALHSGKDILDLFGQYDYIYLALTDFDDELLFASGLLYLGVGPQILAYVLAGLFGCASPPQFVRKIGSAAILSLVKFLIGAGGIGLGTSVGYAYFDGVGDFFRWGFPGALNYVGFGFLLAGFHYNPSGTLMRVLRPAALVRKAASQFLEKRGLVWPKRRRLDLSLVDQFARVSLPRWLTRCSRHEVFVSEAPESDK